MTTIRAIPRAAFKTLNFLYNLLLTHYYITLGWNILPGTNTLAYWALLFVTKKMNCCDCGIWSKKFKKSENSQNFWKFLKHHWDLWQEVVISSHSIEHEDSTPFGQKPLGLKTFGKQILAQQTFNWLTFGEQEFFQEM